jgi:hypothetical protein
MSRKYLLKYRNLDLTRDINERFVGLIDPGIISGGNITVIPSQLKVNIAPWKVFNKQGMVAEETSAILSVDVQVGQTNVLALRVVYNQTSAPLVEFEVVEEGVFNGYTNRDEYIVFGHVIVPLTATEVLASYIDLKPRMLIDPIGRRQERGTINSESLLPMANNLIGDTYKVTDGTGGPVNLFGWNGFTWVNMTNVVALQTQLTQHRQNLFANEKHLTDAEKLAIEGTSGVPSGTNKFVTNSDPRIPTQSENDALVGSHGTPSGVNKYVTQGLEFAQPTVTVVNTPSDPLVVSGAIYLGRGGLGSHLQYFRMFHATEDREYLNSNSAKVDIVAVYKNAGLTQLISNPSSESLSVIDQYGFYIAGPLYLKFNVVPSLPFRLVHGIRNSLGNYKIDMLFDNQPRVAQTSRDVIRKFEEVTGIKYDQVLPTPASNIELYEEVGDIKQYANSSSSTDMVVSDFDKMNSIPEYTGMYEKNIGLMNYTYQNPISRTFTYNNTTGVVTYSGSPSLTSVVNGNVFVDGDENEFVITAKTTSSVTIRDRKSQIPPYINTTISKTLHGSVKVDDNPRRINLSTMQLVQHRERIVASKMIPVANEYHPITGQIAYEIIEPLKSVIFKENRVRAYGNIQNRNISNPLAGPNGGPRTQVFSVNSARYMVTGHFTDLELIADCNQNSPTISIFVDGVAYTSFDLSIGGKGVSFDSLTDVKMKNYPIVSNLTDNQTHTVEIVIPDATPEFVFYGFDLIRRNFDSANLLPGRAFVQGDAVYQNSIETVPLNDVGTLRRGAVTSVLYNRSLQVQSHFYPMTDFDGNSETPVGGVSIGSNQIVVGTGLTKLASFYRIGDIVKVITATNEETKRITNISGGTVTFDSNFNMTGSGAFIHLCSTVSSSYDKEVESRRIVTEFCGLATLSEFVQLPPLVVDRVSILEDGATKFITKEISFTELNVEGYERALVFPNTTSRLKICAVCSSMDIIVANSSNISFTYTINGSTAITKTTGTGGYTRIQLFANGRFQSYEVEIYNAQNMNVVGFIFKEPEALNKPAGLDIGQIKYLAAYRVSLNNPNSNLLPGASLPLGSVGFDAYNSMVKFVNGLGVPWESSIDWTKLYGRYNRSNAEGAYFEWTFYGRTLAFEYTATNDSGYALVQAKFNNDISFRIVKEENFPGAVFAGGIVRNDTIGGGNAGGIVDMYAAVPVRKRIEVEFPNYGRYIVRVQIPSPMNKNANSSNFFINVNQIFFTNSYGYFGYANELARSTRYYLGYSNQYDKRNFGNGTKSLDDLISVVGDVFDLVDEAEEADIIDGGQFV